MTEISGELERLGLEPGSVVMVHASLRAIGHVEGGAEGVISAILRAVGSEGSMMMVLGAEDAHAWVNSHPEHVRARFLADAEPFDATHTPADPDVGTLAEVFRTRPGTVVSDHPEGRFAASGARAIELVRDVPWDDYFGPGSPLDRLVRLNGSVLRLGADPDTVTLLHLAEYLADVPDKRRVRRHRLVRQGDGAVVRVVSCLDDEHGIVDTDDDTDYFSTILNEYLTLDRARTGRVGQATSELIDAPDLLAFGTEWMTARFGRGTD